MSPDPTVEFRTAALQRPLAVIGAGLMTAAGRTLAQSYAASRAGLASFSETTFLDGLGEWVVGAQVPFAYPLRGVTRLRELLMPAIIECTTQAPSWGDAPVPVILCVAERGRPGRVKGIDDALLQEVVDGLNRLGCVVYASLSRVVPQGKTGLLTALRLAEGMLAERDVEEVLIAAADSLLVGDTIAWFLSERRLLTARSSDGLVPGEAGAAIRVTLASRAERPSLICQSLGVGQERAERGSDTSLPADGLVDAIRDALAASGLTIAQVGQIMSCASGEQQRFKEMAIAVTRLLRTKREELPIWYPAGAFGETGAAAGHAMVALAFASSRTQSTVLPFLCTLSDDSGGRAALFLMQAQ